MILIGITGAIGHGKSSLADALAAQVGDVCRLESGTLVTEVANALHAKTDTLPQPDNVAQINKWLESLPQILQDVTHTAVSFEQIKLKPTTFDPNSSEYEKLVLHLRNLQAQPELLTQHITSAKKERYRPILQWLGGYLVNHVDTGIWYKELVRRAQVAADEGCELCVIGGLRFPTDADIVRQAGGFIIAITRPDYAQKDLLDPTESGRNEIKVDAVVLNNGSLTQLSTVAGHIYQDCLDNKQLAYYETNR